MTAYLNLSDLSRRELEDMLLTVHSAYMQTLVSIRSNAPPGWKVRREVEAVAEEVRDRRVFTRAFARFGETRDAALERGRNDRLWSSLSKVP